MNLEKKTPIFIWRVKSTKPLDSHYPWKTFPSVSLPITKTKVRFQLSELFPRNLAIAFAINFSFIRGIGFVWTSEKKRKQRSKENNRPCLSLITQVKSPGWSLILFFYYFFGSRVCVIELSDKIKWKAVARCFRNFIVMCHEKAISKCLNGESMAWQEVKIK